MRFPDFFIVGAPKCGTTSLVHYLMQHPQIFMPENEIHFFSSDLSVFRAVRTWEQYISIFSAAPADAIIGEKSVSYLYSQVAPLEIKKHNPNAKIIIMLRNPIDMMYSLYLHSFRSGMEVAKTFEEALSLEPYRKQGLRIPKGSWSLGLLYRHLAHYSWHIEKYLQLFPRQNIHIILYEEFFSNVDNEFEQVLRFLGVDPRFRPKSYPAINVGRRVKYPRLYALITSISIRLPIFILGDLREALPSNLRQTIRHVKRNLLSLFLEDVKERDLADDIRRELETEFRVEANRLSEILQKDVAEIWFERGMDSDVEET